MEKEKSAVKESPRAMRPPMSGPTAIISDVAVFSTAMRMGRSSRAPNSTMMFWFEF